MTQAQFWRQEQSIAGKSKNINWQSNDLSWWCKYCPTLSSN